MARKNYFAALENEQARNLFFNAIIVLAAIAIAWIIAVIILSSAGCVATFLFTAALAGIVFYKQQKANRREEWIATGHCAACGYDLRATPTKCPECGRDATQDEPPWRRLRRHYDAKPIQFGEKPSRPEIPLPGPIPDDTV